MKRMRHVEGIHNAGKAPDKKKTIIMMDPDEASALAVMALSPVPPESYNIAAQLLAVLKEV